MSAVSKQRERSTNYSESEVRLLINLVCDHKDIIECKKSDAMTWRKKSEAWKEVATSFNARTVENVNRDVATLRVKYESVKKQFKRKVATQNSEMYKSSDGTSDEVIYRDWEEKLFSILSVAECVLQTDIGYDGSPSKKVCLEQNQPTPAIILPIKTETTIDEITPDNIPESLQMLPIDIDSEQPGPSTEHLTEAIEGNSKGMLTKDSINRKYNAIAEERRTLVELQKETAKVQLQLLQKQEANQRQLHELEVERLNNKIVYDEREHEMRMLLLKKQLENSQ